MAQMAGVTMHHLSSVGLFPAPTCPALQTIRGAGVHGLLYVVVMWGECAAPRTCPSFPVLNPILKSPQCCAATVPFPPSDVVRPGLCHVSPRTRSRSRAVSDHVRSRLLTVLVFCTMFVLLVFTVVLDTEESPVVVRR